MQSVCSFLSKFSSLIAWVHSCFDRVIFKGHLPISQPAAFERFVDYTLKMLRKDVLKVCGPQWSERLVVRSKIIAEKAGRPWEYRTGKVDKDVWAKEQLAQNPVLEGLVGVLCVMEACRTFKLAPGQDRPRFVSANIPQRVLYYYFVDKELGFMHVRLQTWAPFTCQVYANGHDYVARQLKKKGIAFEQVDNAFVYLADPAAAQRCADRFAKLPWPKILERYARRVNPLLQAETPRSESLLGHRPGRVRHRRMLCQQARAGGIVWTLAGLCSTYLQPQEDLLLSGPSLARTVRRRSADALQISA